MSERHWCARCRYPGHSPFLFGTVQADGYEAARAALLALWREVSPHPPPATFDPTPGEIVFREGEG